MPRYFIEVSYKGTAYSGFQVQKNSNTIQSEVEKSLEIFFKRSFSLTGSSRTDTGVHALQNFFHFDVGQPLIKNRNTDKLQAPEATSFGDPVLNVQEDLGKIVYHLNAILPHDIVVKRVFQVAENAHCRFDAASREYKYFIYSHKNPFLEDRAYYFPYKLDVKKLENAAAIILQHRDFTSFSKKHTQVNNFICEIIKSEWALEKDTLVYTVKANRFLRGMVKGLVGTMLRLGRNIITLKEFEDIIKSRDCSKADFSVAPHALFLISVNYN